MLRDKMHRCSCWNTEGPKNVEENVSTAVVRPNAICINPLNWRLDDTYAPASENLGSYMPNAETGEYEITDVGAIHRSEEQIWERLPLGCRCFRS
jgi:hypothetical protein